MTGLSQCPGQSECRITGYECAIIQWRQSICRAPMMWYLQEIILFRFGPNNKQTRQDSTAISLPRAGIFIWVPISMASSALEIHGSNTGVAFPSDLQWHHYAVVRTSTNTFLYIDGALVATKGGAIPSPV